MLLGRFKYYFITILLFGGILPNCPGDVNNDLNLDVLDVVLIVGHVLSTTELNEEQIYQADIN